MQYSTEQLITMITTNNMAGIHARLVADGLVMQYSNPSVDSLQYAINEKWSKSSSDEFFAWIERLFDVPTDMNQMYYSELQNIRNSTGKTPARMLAEQLRAETPVTELKQPESQVALQIKRTVAPRWVSLVFWGLAIIGLVAVIRFAARLVAKVTE